MEKIYYLVKRVDAAIDNSASMLDDEELFGSPDSCVTTECEEELDNHF